jgi:eukaryotic-like serine/threonine-protein kinase
MKIGELLHGYRITCKPRNDGAGKCMWAFAEKGGEEYFIKEFLEPKRPRPEGMGTAETKRASLKQCEDFERRHWSVIERIDPRHENAGNLVTAIDFFCEGTRYYKVTTRLYPDELVRPHELTTHQKSVLLGTLADSLQLLHDLRIVHGDLKPQNILLHQPHSSDLYTAKLIDFDDAYVSQRPPDRDIIGGDAHYGAPEWVRYMRGDPKTGPERLTTAADMFAFGLLLHHYLTGALPHYDRRYSSPAEAINAGARIHLDPRLHERIAQAMRSLLTYKPNARPKIAELLRLVSDESVLALHERPPVTTSAGDSRRVRINVRNGSSTMPVDMGRLRFEPPAYPDESPVPSPASPGERRSRVRIHLEGRTSTKSDHHDKA